MNLFLMLTCFFNFYNLGCFSRKNTERSDSTQQWRDSYLKALNTIIKHKLINTSDDVDHNTPDLPRPVFNCTMLSPSDKTPDSVHRLRPGDVRVVAAIGDSVTAGNGLGADNIIEVLNENRGESWSIGGDKSLDDNVVTLPNILKKFNPDVRGYSTGFGGEDDTNAWFNQAVPGAIAKELIEQVDELVELMFKDSRINLKEDWKIVTLLIGGNDLCNYCQHKEERSPKNFARNIRAALDRLEEKVPRTLVNVVPILDVSVLTKLSDGLTCDVIHDTLCPCAVDGPEEISGIQKEYFTFVEELLKSGRYDRSDNFTVVLQPFMKNLIPPLLPSGKMDGRFVSYDCFHPSRFGHISFAYMLWNEMLTSSSKKRTAYTADDLKSPVLRCPSEDKPFIFTMINGE